MSATAKSRQSCPTLCDPIDGSPPDSPVPGILQVRTLEWVAISFSNAWKWKVKGKSLSRVWPSATPWTAAFQAPPSMGFSRQEYWSGVPLPSPRDYVSAYNNSLLSWLEATGRLWKHWKDGQALFLIISSRTLDSGTWTRLNKYMFMKTEELFLLSKVNSLPYAIDTNSSHFIETLLQQFSLLSYMF